MNGQVRPSRVDGQHYHLNIRDPRRDSGERRGGAYRALGTASTGLESQSFHLCRPSLLCTPRRRTVRFTAPPLSPVIRRTATVSLNDALRGVKCALREQPAKSRCVVRASQNIRPRRGGGLARTSYRVAGSELQWQDHDGFGAIEGRGDILLRRICRARRARSCSPVRQAAVSAGRRGSAAQKVQRRGVRQRRRCETVAGRPRRRISVRGRCAVATAQPFTRPSPARALGQYGSGTQRARALSTDVARNHCQHTGVHGPAWGSRRDGGSFVEDGGLK